MISHKKHISCGRHPERKLNSCYKSIQPKKMSKTARLLIKTLRHDLVKIGVIPTADGYVKVSDLTNRAPGLSSLTLSELQSIAESDDKGRFSLKCSEDGTWLIRANQGHSKVVGDHIDAGECMTLIKEPIPGVFHGTYKEHKESIQSSGLQPMRRKHIHIAKSLDAKSGKRHNCTLLVYINMDAAMRDGIQFYESSNGVILTEGPLEPKYLTFVEI
jgi:RNA:NAD 2'-phosphotransferase (TPT1/KptA family)